MSKILVTGANGQLGRLVMHRLLQSMSAENFIAGVRDVSKASFDNKRIEVREVDYNRPQTLKKAFKDIKKLLLISSSEVGRRVEQHKAVIDAAKEADIGFIAYTSILHADTSPLLLAIEHRKTEAILESSGIPYSLLRNGWYLENHLMSIPSALEHGVLMGCAGNGYFSSAPRIDYAEAAATILINDISKTRKIYELAGDTAYTLAEFAFEVSAQSSKNIVYQDLPEKSFKEALIKVGLPIEVVDIVVSSDIGASKGGLFDDSKTLSSVIGRPTALFKNVLSGFLKK
ncbi:NADPH:quinone oxidoreductase 2 [Liberibacter crescens BT-1]|uniref:NADPH:quinone oxidoreductase 2 n=1 Tax=Liberibacter crescens (strain BT-1) TaxID=1215343 RepID=L0EVD8_LIBCB|nr:SDR family oxidoreductase [Liberibacter crescens]AGA64361.1 NADPH:quinone oxidoreductase 2 [Liberibacter crescens BT-1]AMC12555.1 quinone oxidoreductase [Liberibacter crescens]